MIAVIHGIELGGGLEPTLRCHFRVAVKDSLGQTRPAARRRRNAAAVAGGRTGVRRQDDRHRRTDRRARSPKHGLIDEMVKGPAADGAIAFANKVVAEQRPLRLLRHDDSKLLAAKADGSLFTAAAAATTRKNRGIIAPLACAEAVRWTPDTPFNEALNKER